MTQLGFFIDLTKCTGCQTCTVACKDAHTLEVGRNFRKVLEAESGSWKQDKATGASTACKPVFSPSAWNPVRSAPSSSVRAKNCAASTASSLRSLRCPILRRRSHRW